MPLWQTSDLTRPVLSQFSLSDKICLVTGGSRGIGAHIVSGLAEAGAAVAFTYSSTPAEDAVALASKISAATGQRVEAYKCNVTDRVAVHAVVDEVVSGFGHGRLDVVIANAGVCSAVRGLDYDEKSWGHINNVNYDGVMWTAQAAGKIFEKQGRGNLVITASVSAHIVNVPQKQAAYNASKAAALQLARGLAVEWTEFARVNCVSPGYVWTEMVNTQPRELFEQWLAMIPAGRMCDPAELKALYVFLASDACPYMTGANLVVDGGFTIP